MDALFNAFAVLMFAAVILLTEGAYLWWSGTHGGEARRISRRLRNMSGGAVGEGERVSILKQRRYSASDGLDKLLHEWRIAHAIDRRLVQAGLSWTVAQFMGMSAGSLALGLALAQLLPMPTVAVCVVGGLCMAIPYYFLMRSRRARLTKIEEQLPEAADFIARALRSGHSFTNVLQMVGTELPEPLSGEFRGAHEEINYGVPLNEALHNLADRIPLTDLRYLIIAVVIQRESGGNLAEILGNIGHIIRERLKLLGQVRVLSAEGRMSAWILGALPFVVIVLMSMSNYKYISMLWTDPTGIRIMWYGAGMIVVGIIWLRRVIRIHV
jgi:tight adherence protein B